MKSKIQKSLSDKQLKLSSAELDPGPAPSSKAVKTARLQFSESSRVLRRARHCFFHGQASHCINRLSRADGDFAKRRALRDIAEDLQIAGIYSDKTPISSVEHMILTRLYRISCSSGNPIEWKPFCDRLAGPSYWQCLSFWEVEAVAKAAGKRAK